MSSGFDRRGANKSSNYIVASSNTGPLQTEGSRLYTAPMAVPDPKAMGYTGNTCNACQGTRMMIAGHCEVCSDCGTTTGCS